MQILDVNQIRIPKEAFIEQEIKPEHWLFGAKGGMPLNSYLDWTSFITEYELQRNAYFDAYDCVTQTAWNMYQILINFKYKQILDKSKRYTAVISGTQPRRGNSMQAPFESIRKDDCVDETEWPSMSQTMTEVEFFKAIPEWVKKQVNFLKDFSTNHEWLPCGTGVPTAEQMLTALAISPVGVVVNGNYQFDANGNLSNHGPLTHALLIVKAEPGKRWLALDSENPNGLLPIKWDYKFQYCKVGYVEKKNSTPLDKPFIQYGKGIYQLAKDGKYKGQYVGWNSEPAFRAVIGDWKNAEITKVEELPSNMSDVLIDTLKNPSVNTGAKFDAMEWLQSLFK